MSRPSSFSDEMSFLPGDDSEGLVPQPSHSRPVSLLSAAGDMDADPAPPRPSHQDVDEIPLLDFHRGPIADAAYPRAPSVSNTSTSTKSRSMVELKTVGAREDRVQPPAGFFRPAWNRQWRQVFLDTWFAEAFAIAISLLCLGAIIVVLQVYQGKTVPHLPYKITLNAIVSTLGTTCRALLTGVVAGAIGQLKWCRFSKNRTLQDMQTMDSASRGALGSLSILTAFHKMPLAAIGALVTVFALAFDPFVQQVIRYPQRLMEIPSHEAAAPFAPNLRLNFSSAGSFPTINNTATSQPAFYQALHSGMWSDLDSFQLQPRCPVATCNWPAYESIGWCSSCVDATPRASLTHCDWPEAYNVSRINHCQVDLGYGNPYRQVISNIHLDEWDYYGIANTAVWALSNFTDFSNTTRLGVDNPLLSMGWAKIDTVNGTIESGLRVVHAEECVLSLCSREYNVTVTNGSTQVATPSVSFGRVWPNTSQDICWQAESDQTTNLTDKSERLVENTTACAVNGYVAPIVDLLSGNGSFHMENHSSLATASSDMYGSDGVAAVSVRNLSVVMDGIAASLTRLNLATTNGTTFVSGNITANENYVHVTWEWLILPIILEILTLAVLMVAVVQSARQQAPLWRSSLLPLLFHGLEDPVGKDGEVSNKLSGMEVVARRRVVGLAASDDTGHLLLRSG